VYRPPRRSLGDFAVLLSDRVDGSYRRGSPTLLMTRLSPLCSGPHLELSLPPSLMVTDPAVAGAVVFTRRVGVFA